MAKINLDDVERIEGLAKRWGQISREIIFTTKEDRPKNEIAPLRKEMTEIYEELFSLRPER